MPPMNWLAMNYSVPVTPSKSRVYVWRKLREIGAGCFRPGMAVLPENTQNLAVFRQLQKKIFELGGEAVVTEMKYLDSRDEQWVVTQFRRQSEDEYRELIRESAGILDQGRSEELRKLIKRYGKARQRDYFDSREDIAQGLVDLADDMERVTGELGRQLRNILDL